MTTPRSALLAALAVTLAAALTPSAARAASTAESAQGPPLPNPVATMSFRSRPDLVPPAVLVSRSLPGQADGDLFLAPKLGQGQGGPMILDRNGNLVFFDREPGEVRANDFRVQSYDGQPVLTWWEGLGSGGFGRGEGVIMNAKYQVIARVKAGGGLSADLHEFLLTSRGTAYITAYEPVRRDLTAYGGGKSQYALDGVIEEVDVKTGKVLWSWHSMYHVGLSESAAKPPSDGGYYDYFHINSIGEDTDGNLIVSARLTDTVYKISRTTGAIIWRLGGKRSDFKFGPGAAFARQHDAVRYPDGTITLFDNSAIDGAERSRGIHLALDFKGHRAKLAGPVLSDGQFFASTQGSVQPLAGGTTFMDWGNRGRLSEFDAKGAVLFDLRLARGYDTYRAYKQTWVGTPVTKPTVRIISQGSGKTAFVSWNGATEVASWQLLAGGNGKLGVAGPPVPATGFETQVDVSGRQFVALRALDADGDTLGQSTQIRVQAKAAPAKK